MPSLSKVDAGVAEAACQACLDGDLELLKELNAAHGPAVLSACSTVRVSPDVPEELRKRGDHASVSRMQQEDGVPHEEGAIFTPGFDHYTLRTQESAKKGGMPGKCKASSTVQWAAFGGHLDVLKFLSEQNHVNVKLTGEFGWTPDSIAYCRRWKDAANWLQGREPKT